ncbi:hypothetical protein [Sphingomonas carotinifaciens]|uniref:DUF418 domain-containing protein n=1 Tax=Sphingomonas carotinifaciens TaxID=1166323 RepID=A0A1G7M2Z3_9SPHN|nr:hypothetical protein [Sphingomonas carotinifaciens]MBB4086937.1 hypothetical protein [Sphingomonas carotinifaciens]MWC42131.1 hypothetical protein [Sphingomonas carotinifaciens]SDF56198.1 hypothetical protein SAMN05216557_10458 [Sphingomonas carotinifaciens]
MPEAHSRISLVPRLTGIDAARGIAVIGMYLQHFGDSLPVSAIVSGNTTLLFVLCGGIAYSLMAQRSGFTGAPQDFRTRMLGRAVFIDLLGYLLIMLNTSFGVILPAYAVLFVAALVLVGRSTRTLVISAVLLLFFAPPAMLLGLSLLGKTRLLADIAGGPLSGLALAPAFVVGMIIGRLDLNAVRTAGWLAVPGAVIFAVMWWFNGAVLPGFAKGFEAWLVTLMDTSMTPEAAMAAEQMKQFAPWPNNTDPAPWQMLFASAPHTASTFQTLTGLSLSLAVVGICLAAAQHFRSALLPFSTIGRVPLTMYAAQFVVAWGLALGGVELTQVAIPGRTIIIIVGAIALGMAVWALRLNVLERAMRHVDRALGVDKKSI